MQDGEHVFYDPEAEAEAQAIAVLRQGASAWNSWIRRRDHVGTYEPKFFPRPHRRANLRRANLQGADLDEFDLRRVDLQGAILTGASLVNASLVDADAELADFSGAICRNTDFSYARLRGARFSQADCRWAQFHLSEFSDDASLDGAQLQFASFRWVDFGGASLREAVLDNTLFGGCDLSHVVGLDSCWHEGPSWLDIATLLRSRRALSYAFLRQTGVPEVVITYLPSLLAEPVQFYSCFISYSSADGRFADRLHDDLQKRGVRCWYAPDRMSIGDRIRDTLDESIRLHDKVVVVLSKDSVESHWVEEEVETALEKERESNRRLPEGGRISVLFPIKIDNALDNTRTAWARSLVRSRHIGDFRNWNDPDQYVGSLERLVRDLRSGR
jgi:uncharacterized protein YjbI with pentapeptide repeats